MPSSVNFCDWGFHIHLVIITIIIINNSIGIINIINITSGVSKEDQNDPCLNLLMSDIK